MEMGATVCTPKSPLCSGDDDDDDHDNDHDDHHHDDHDDAISIYLSIYLSIYVVCARVYMNTRNTHLYS